MPQSHSLIFHIQLVQMVDPPIPTYSRLDPGHLAASIAVLPQSSVEAVDQGFSGEGLGEETNRSRLQGSDARVLDGKRRDENERHPESLGEQMGLQLETAHRRHLNICYHARGVIELR